MGTKIHFIDVGQGNMVLIETFNGEKFIFDCNVTNENEHQILNYLAESIGIRCQISAFICSHRDADHMRGIQKIHNVFPINRIWDSGYPGNSTGSTEYEEYMQLRRTVGSNVVKRQTRYDYGRTRIRILSSTDERLQKNPNAQGIVLKIEQRTSDMSTVQGSAILPGDSDAQTWRNAIMKDYSPADVKTDILMGGHHGSISFFDDPADTKNYYLEHIRSMSPALSVISVGDNSFGHPHSKSLVFYNLHSTGTKAHSKKVYRTDTDGSMTYSIYDDGSGNFY